LSPSGTGQCIHGRRAGLAAIGHRRWLADLGQASVNEVWFNTAMTPRSVSAPPLVTVIAILQYIGGGLLIVYALLGNGAASSGVAGMLPPWGQLLYGGLFIVLARALQLGVHWARRVTIVLCWIGLALAALYLITAGVQVAVIRAVWPATYLVLLTRASVRDWCTPKVRQDSDQ
jgi:hypothetical protein